MNNNNIKTIINKKLNTEELNIRQKYLQNILDFSQCDNIKKLNCELNEITGFLNLPCELVELYCDNNKISNLDNLPFGLEILECSDNKISFLDNLPCRLKILRCANNQVLRLNMLPESLEELNCSNNIIRTIMIFTMLNNHLNYLLYPIYLCYKIILQLYLYNHEANL